MCPQHRIRPSYREDSFTISLPNYSVLLPLHCLSLELQATEILRPNFTLAKNKFKERLEIWNTSLGCFILKQDYTALMMSSTNA